MQMHADTNCDLAIDELRLALPPADLFECSIAAAALQNVIAARTRGHRARSGLRQRLAALRAYQIRMEAE